MEQRNFTDDIEYAAKMGKWAAESKNDADPFSPDSINNAFMEFLTLAPSRYQPAMLTAYTVAYVKERKL